MENIKDYIIRRCNDGLTLCGIPNYMHGGVKLWLTDGIRPGSFLEAVLENDLKRSVLCADENNKKILPNWATFMLHYMPLASQGSVENVSKWLGINYFKGEDNEISSR